MSESSTLCIAVNKNGSTLKPSETFLRAHMERLPFRTVSLIGNPGNRKRFDGAGEFLQSRALPLRGARWLLNRAGVKATSQQDTEALTALLRSERAEVMMAEYGPTALTVVDASAEAGVPLLTHFHGWDAYVLAPKAETRAQYQSLFERSEAIIAVSRHMRDHLVSIGAPADRTIWNPCGADPDPTPARPDLAPPQFITVGRPAPKKATVVILLAFAEVMRAVPDARLSLVGAHADAVMNQLLRALGIAHAVTFHGTLPHADVLSLMRSARCYLHPSVTAPDGDMEGTPVSVLEGMACGLPVVSTRHGGILDVLDGTDAGILVDEYDVPATAAAMMRYATSPDLARSSGEQGRRLLTEQWSMARSLHRLGKVLEATRRRDRSALRALTQDDAGAGKAPGTSAAAAHSPVSTS